jgi:hypothetical protein
LNHGFTITDTDFRKSQHIYILEDSTVAVAASNPKKKKKHTKFTFREREENGARGWPGGEKRKEKFFLLQ